MLRYYLDSLSVYLYVRLPIVLYLCFHISTYLSSLCTSYSHSLILYAFFSLRYVSIFVSCSVYALVCTYLVLYPLSAYVCLLIGTYIFCHQCTFICMYVSMYECTDVCMYVCVYVCMYRCMCVAMYIPHVQDLFFCRPTLPNALLFVLAKSFLQFKCICP